MTERVEVVRPDELRPAAGTAGMRRQVAVETDRLWAGRVDTDPGVDSGWHHHDGHHSVIYVLEGRIRIDFGPGGGESVEAGAGDFISIPPRVVHREVSPEAAVRVVAVRSGQGEIVVNVDGPDAV